MTVPGTIAAAEANAFREPTPMFKVRDLTRSFLGELAGRVKTGQTEAATLAWYRAQLVKLDQVAGDVGAAELRTHHLHAVEFTHHFVRALRALYRWGVDEDQQLVPRDPFKKLKPPPCGERSRVLTRPEFRRLYLSSPREFRRFLFVLSRTLARPGEIRCMTWGSIQWERRLITLVKFKGRKRRTDGVKLRTIPLDLVTLRLLRNKYRRAGSPAPDASVWLDRGGKPLTSNALRCRMRLARFKAGLNPAGAERVVCYTLRHTGATNASRRGIRGKLLSDWMGHARSATTDRYQHLDGADLVEAADQLAARGRGRGHTDA